MNNPTCTVHCATKKGNYCISPAKEEFLLVYVSAVIEHCTNYEWIYFIWKHVIDRNLSIVMWVLSTACQY